MQDGLTKHFHNLMARLDSIRGFLETLNKLGILTADEVRVIYSQQHFTCLDLLTKSDE